VLHVLVDQYAHNNWMLSLAFIFVFTAVCTHALQHAAVVSCSSSYINVRCHMSCLLLLPPNQYPGRFLQELYGPRTAADAAAAAAAGPGGSAAAAAAGAVVISSADVEQLASWNSRVTAARRTKTVRQKWQELLLSVSGEFVI
jgi:hypothetical protein